MTELSMMLYFAVKDAGPDGSPATRAGASV